GAARRARGSRAGWGRGGLGEGKTMNPAHCRGVAIGRKVRSHVTAVLITIVALVSASSYVAGADFLLVGGRHNISGEPSAAVTLFGEISVGDADRLEAIIVEQNEGGVELSEIRLLSHGGVLNEGLALGRII